MQTVTSNWRTSSYTGTENCVEVADNEPNQVMVRDTKARSRGIVTFRTAAWAAFVELAKKA
ncbi:DUF397 domain-containing protein [Streptomyces sp. S.PB5]|uniref:DUF397 domain-containing protein n=1 Tax=Streptomyces sp. S.PB5 TaxID=3020844 RepID=UPI0025AF6E43|nr:DUF397 domain-containing protein [Streptomyces sp. S.PB5]MDN3029397.1 DUF397 domain-containing protein [Streptomyces sp. S.PB5]